LSLPAQFGWSMFATAFRTPQGARRPRPSIVRLVLGVLWVAVFALLLLGQIDGWAYLETQLSATSVASLLTSARGAWTGLRTSLPATLTATIALALLGLVYQIGYLVRSEKVHVSQPARPRDPEGLGPALGELKRRDEAFSRVLFLDFVQALYHGLHGWLGTPAYRNLCAFASDEVTAALAREAGAGARTSAIVLGMMKIERIDLASEAGVGGGMDAIVVELEGNYTRERDGAAPVRLVVRERWRLERPSGVVSPPPERMRALTCPLCGAALSVSTLGACSYCQAPLSEGKVQWRLTRRAVLSTETFSTEGLGETVPEEGTDLPTLRDPEVEGEGAVLAQAQGQPGFEAFADAFHRDTVAPIFRRMYAAWSSKRWHEVRHLLTDFLWEAQQHWVRAYADKGLTNKLDDLALTGVEVVRVERDRYFDAVTVRLHARCKDYTTDRAGRVIGVDAERPRSFSEYWTFVRAATAKTSAAKAGENECPNCGAPLDQMGSTGICGYCKAKVTTGDFGWVLATIAQDEVYTG
jgi:predicted lipid-binding transport protein (Tim44 family)